MNRPMDVNEARALAYRWERANRMTAEGYTARPSGVTDGHFVDSPAGEVYHVQQLTNGDAICTCPDWQRRETNCKHTLWMQIVQREAQQVAEFEARYGACEDELTGCDAYAEY